MNTFTKEELQFLEAKILPMIRLVEKLCKEEMEK